MEEVFLAGCNFYLLWATVGLIGIWLVFNYWKKNSNLPPGPRGLPIVGYYFSLGRTPHIHLKELAKTYGDVLSFRTLGGTPIIILNSLEIVKDVFVNRSSEFLGRPLQENMMCWIDDGLGIAQEEGQAWKEQRRFFAQSAKKFGFGTVQIESSIHQLIGTMMKDIKNLGGQPFDPLIHICQVATNVVSKILFNKQFAKNDPLFLTAVEDIETVVHFFTDTRLFIYGKFMDCLLHFSSTGTKAKTSKRRLKTLAKSIVDDHIKKFDPKNLEDFVDDCLHHMGTLEENGQLKSSSFSRERLAAVAMNMFMEGTGSVSVSFCNYILKLSQHSDVQKKAQEELDKEIGKGRHPSWADRSKLPYLSAVIQELYRTSSIFDFSTNYCNFEETQIKGYSIPKRSIIFANLYSLNNDPQLYPNPSKFYPERFLDSSGKRIKTEGPFSFGIGKRTCIGEPLTQMEMFFILAALLQNFNLCFAGDGKIRAVARDDDISTL